MQYLRVTLDADGDLFSATTYATLDEAADAARRIYGDRLGAWDASTHSWPIAGDSSCCARETVMSEDEFLQRFGPDEEIGG